MKQLDRDTFFYYKYLLFELVYYSACVDYAYTMCAVIWQKLHYNTQKTIQPEYNLNNSTDSYNNNNNTNKNVINKLQLECIVEYFNEKNMVSLYL